MRFRTHFLTSLAAGLVLYPRNPVRAAALVAAGTLIDLDHLLLYSVRTGDWSVVGALRYDHYRHRWRQAGDNRPRYGPLRSWLHAPLMVLPMAWLLAARHPSVRPIALGLSLHLLLDHHDWPWRYAARLRARGICQGCGRRGRRLTTYRTSGSSARRYRVLCRTCAERAATLAESSALRSSREVRRRGTALRALR